MTYVTGIAHIGIAVSDIEAATHQYLALGFLPMHDGIVRAEGHGVRTKMLNNNGYVIELVAPLEEGVASPVDAYIAKTYHMYHVCYRVSDFDAQIELLRKERFVMIDEPKPSDVLGGRRTVFMFNRKHGVIELVEEEV